MWRGAAQNLCDPSSFNTLGIVEPRPSNQSEKAKIRGSSWLSINT